MTGKITNLSFLRTGEQILTIALDGDYTNAYDRLRGVKVDIDIRKHSEKRSLTANAYFHTLCHMIAEKCGLGDEEIKRGLVTEYGTMMRGKDGACAGLKLPAAVDIDMVYPYTKCFDNNRVEDGIRFKCYILYKRTRDMNTAEFCRLIDGTIYEAKNLGLETDTPEELARLKSLWEREEK